MLKMSAALVGSILLISGCSHFHRTKPEAASTETTITSSSGQQVAVSPSASVAGRAVPQTVTGEVTRVNWNTGAVTVKTATGTKMTVALPPLAVATVNKGDRASFEVTITPR